MLSHRPITLRAGQIKRHPKSQRRAQPKRWEAECGAFNPALSVTPIQVVEDPMAPGFYLAIDGAHRVEACCAAEDYGPDTELECWLWSNGNGAVPSTQQLSHLFLLCNAFGVKVGAGTAFSQALLMEDPAALATLRQKERLGSRFDTTTKVWKAIRRGGEERVHRTFDFIIAVWPTGEITGQLFSAIHKLLGKQGTRTMLVKRKRTLGRRPAKAWVSDADHRMLRTVGKRASPGEYIQAVLLGRSTGRVDLRVA